MWSYSYEAIICLWIHQGINSISICPKIAWTRAAEERGLLVWYCQSHCELRFNYLSAQVCALWKKGRALTPRAPSNIRQPKKNASFCFLNPLHPSPVTSWSSPIKHFRSFKVSGVSRCELLLYQSALWCWHLCPCSPRQATLQAWWVQICPCMWIQGS